MVRVNRRQVSGNLAATGTDGSVGLPGRCGRGFRGAGTRRVVYLGTVSPITSLTVTSIPSSNTRAHICTARYCPAGTSSSLVS